MSGKWLVASGEGKENPMKAASWKWFLKAFHAWVCRADDWCFAQERKMQVLATSHSPLATDSEFDPVASAARERKQKAKRLLPRLRYSQGAWVRQ